MASPLPNHLLNWMWYTKIAWNIHKLPKLPRNKTTQGAKWGTPGIPALGRKGGKMGEFSKTPSPMLPSPPRRQRQLKLPHASFYAASLSVVSSWKCYQSHSLFINTWSLKWCRLGAVAHASCPSTRNTGASTSLSWKPAWSTMWILSRSARATQRPNKGWREGSLG